MAASTMPIFGALLGGVGLFLLLVMFLEHRR